MKLSKSPSDPLDTRWITSIAMFLLGIGLVIYGSLYNLNHIDNGPGSNNYSNSLGALSVVGFLIIVSIPLVFKRWKITVAVIMVALIAYAYMALIEYAKYGAN